MPSLRAQNAIKIIEEYLIKHKRFRPLHNFLLNRQSDDWIIEVYKSDDVALKTEIRIVQRHIREAGMISCFDTVEKIVNLAFKSINKEKIPWQKYGF